MIIIDENYEGLFKESYWFVYKGDLIGTCEDKLGANVHASINGKVIDITDSYIEIKA